MVLHRLARAFIALLLPALLLACAAGSNEPAGRDADGTIGLSILTDTGAHDYRVELAMSAPEQARGLMYRQDMPADRGMLFPFDPVRPASFWMKNTYIPLDMIFIAPDGTIESVAADTVPLVESGYASRGPVQAVLELNAGEAARIGAKPGDKVIYELPR